MTDDLEATATYVDCDVSSVDNLESTLDEAEQFDDVDVLVNNAGLFQRTTRVRVRRTRVATERHCTADHTIAL
ncbi:SDR family NAD(P)-dependent oxidoreductase [Natrinema sp. CBA1119]|uniref:SDR family NAD(P)-dependent oxidoreductase n=1 Tax=Natrinema sp. CBA1119 TaxID=1608465 RepID=UPI0020D28028|nr:SDR family NAD(P)-dependent oxidoreductase [Natrinema sp. CBA1119]